MYVAKVISQLAKHLFCPVSAREKPDMQSRMNESPQIAFAPIRLVMPDEYNVNTSMNNITAIDGTDVVVLAVKPQIIETVGPILARLLTPEARSPWG